MRGRGQYVGDIRLPGMHGGGVPEEPAGACAHQGHPHPAGDPRPRVHRRGPGGRVGDPRRHHAAGLQVLAAAGAGDGQGALRRRAGRHVRRADAGGGRGPRRRDRAGSRSAARRRRHAGGAQGRRAAGARALGRQPLSHHRHRRGLRGRQGQGRRLGHARAAHLAPGHEPARGPRRGRAMALAAGPAGRAHLDPAAAHRALGAGRMPRAGRGPDPRGGARCRRRLRLQGHPAAGGDRAGLGDAQGRRAAAVDRGPAREPHRQRQLPRAPLHPHRLRRRRRPPAGARLRGDRRFRRLLGLPVLRLPGGGPRSPRSCRASTTSRTTAAAPIRSPPTSRRSCPTAASPAPACASRWR